MQNFSVFLIVYSRGDKSILSIAEIQNDMIYEREDYSIASRQDFYNIKDAHEHALYLSSKHNLKYKFSSDIQNSNIHDYLD